MWTARPVGQRGPSDAVDFSDELWTEGHRVAKTQTNHYQMVMSIIRGRIES